MADAHSLPQLLRLPQVMSMTGLARSAIYAFEARGEFPTRVKLTQRSTAWRADEVADWINSRPRGRQEAVTRPAA